MIWLAIYFAVAILHAIAIWHLDFGDRVPRAVRSVVYGTFWPITDALMVLTLMEP